MPTTPSPYEQLKNDLGYLQLGRATECFATVADRANEDWSHVEYLAAVMAEQVAATTNRRLAARLRYARFPYVRSLADFDFGFQPSVDNKLVEDLASCASSRRTGPSCFWVSPGVARPTWPWRSPPGRSRPATGATSRPRRPWCGPAPGPPGGELRHQAAGIHRTVGPGRRRRGTAPHRHRGGRGVLHVVNARYENGHPTLVTTNRGLPAWGDVFGDPVVAGAILDRLMHRAVVFNIKGPSWRMREHSPWPRRPRHEHHLVFGSVPHPRRDCPLRPRTLPACPPPRPTPRCSNCGSLWRRWILRSGAGCSCLRGSRSPGCTHLPGGHGVDRFPPPRLHHRRQALRDALDDFAEGDGREEVHGPQGSRERAAIPLRVRLRRRLAAPGGRGRTKVLRCPPSPCVWMVSARALPRTAAVPTAMRTCSGQSGTPGTRSTTSTSSGSATTSTPRSSTWPPPTSFSRSWAEGPGDGWRFEDRRARAPPGPRCITSGRRLQLVPLHDHRSERHFPSSPLFCRRPGRTGSMLDLRIPDQLQLPRRAQPVLFDRDFR